MTGSLLVAVPAQAVPALAPLKTVDTSFESGQAQPTWTSSVDQDSHGRDRCFGVTNTTATGTGPGMATAVDTGPTTAYAARTKVGFTGTHALHYSGHQSAVGNGSCNNKLFNVNIPVRADTDLSYVIFPQLMDQNLGTGIPSPSTFVSVDLGFSDGTYLSRLAAVDQNGFGMSAAAQGAANALYPNQWNKVSADLGKVAAGRIVTRVLISYNRQGGATDFSGWIDDLKIGANTTEAPASLADQVITTRGTQSNGDYSRGNNIPATALPHGFNFFTPVTNAGTTGFIYNYSTDNDAQNRPKLQALAISHQPSPWINDRDTFQVMPQTGTAGATPDFSRNGRALTFSHANEVAKPYYYGVTFDDGTKAEMTPTDHAADMRFTFTGATSNLILDNINNSGALTIDPATNSISGYSSTAGGFGAPGSGPMYFYATFDQPISAGGKVAAGGCDGAVCGGNDVTGYVQFSTAAAKTVTMSIATSYISIAQAQHNLTLEIAPSATFDTVRSTAKAAWNKALGVISVDGATPDQQVSLYSDLYRVNLYPNSAYENVGTSGKPDYQYASPTAPSAGPNTATHTGLAIKTGYMYVNGGFWDTYRTEWPLLTLLYPTLTGQMIGGFLNQYRDGGWLSRWSAPGYNGATPGTSADIAFADAYLNGVHNFPVTELYEAMKKDSMTVATNGAVGRQGMSSSQFLGYSPVDAGGGSVDWSLEDEINDFGISQLATTLAAEPGTSKAQRNSYEADAKFFRAKSDNYVKLYNPQVGFFQGRTATGAWRQSSDQYNPNVWGNEYQESNAWQYIAYAPQDPQGLANLYGGKSGLADKLDDYFGTHETSQLGGSYGGANAIHEMLEVSTNNLGQWELNNQPGFGIPYFYDFTSQPYKAQSMIRTGLARDFTGSEIGQGYPGDEDNGALSSWYIFSALGIYPLQVGTGRYAVGSPLFTRATINLENGKTIRVEAPANSTRNVYVKSLKLDGKAVRNPVLNVADLADGATLEFGMSAHSTSWGTGSVSLPSSSSTAIGGTPLLNDAAEAGNGAVSSPSGVNVAPLFDNTSTTQVTFPTTTPTVEYDFNQPQAVTFYTLTSGTAAGDPTAWTVQGSNDGTRWNTLDSRSNQATADRQQTRDYQIANPKAFTRYRIVVSASSGTASTSLAEIQLMTSQNLVAIPFTTPQRTASSDGITVQPGTSTTVTLGVQNVTSKKEAVTWTAQAPAGVTVSSPQPFTVAAHGTGSSQVQITVPATDGTFEIYLHPTANGVDLPAVPVKLLVLSPGDLTPYFNNTGISDDSAQAAADLDGVGSSLSAQALASAGLTAGKPFTTGGLTYTWPDVPVAQPDNIVAQGQTIQLASPAAGATKLGFLGTSTFGPSQGTATVTYTDGSTQQATVAYSDWTSASSIPANSALAATLPYRNKATGTSEQKATYVFSSTIALTAGKTVAKVTLPTANTGQIHIFAITAG